jgi:hypothetical protein
VDLICFINLIMIELSKNIWTSHLFQETQNLCNFQFWNLVTVLSSFPRIGCIKHACCCRSLDSITWIRRESIYCIHNTAIKQPSNLIISVQITCTPAKFTLANQNVICNVGQREYLFVTSRLLLLDIGIIKRGSFRPPLRAVAMIRGYVPTPQSVLFP